MLRVYNNVLLVVALCRMDVCSLSVRALVWSEEKSATKGSMTKFHHSLSIYHDYEYTPLLADVCSGFCHYGFVVILIFTSLFMFSGNGRQYRALARGCGWSSSSAQCTRNIEGSRSTLRKDRDVVRQRLLRCSNLLPPVSAPSISVSVRWPGHTQPKQSQMSAGRRSQRNLRLPTRQGNHRRYSPSQQWWNSKVCMQWRNITDLARIHLYHTDIKIIALLWLFGGSISA